MVEAEGVWGFKLSDWQDKSNVIVETCIESVCMGSWRCQLEIWELVFLM